MAAEGTTRDTRVLCVSSAQGCDALGKSSLPSTSLASRASFLHVWTGSMFDEDRDTAWDGDGLRLCSPRGLAGG